ncbi:hypothetical protein AB395_00006865 (plasmid) [Sinorhizobium fredii CCBAU 45436]|nr:hypothetical protein AB395_00006865 [Sinorhizobium fredii CCBAU 45436]
MRVLPDRVASAQIAGHVLDDGTVGGIDGFRTTRRKVKL